MSSATIPTPRPPAQLWGLWVVSSLWPEGFWWNHTHGVHSQDTPMTFVSKEDAEASLEGEQNDMFDDDGVMVVALIGVAPPTPEPPTTEHSTR